MALDLDRGIALTWHPDLAGIDPGHVNSVLCAIDDRRRQSRCALLFPGDIMQEQRLINPHFNEWSFEQAAVKFLTNDPSIGMVALIKPSKRIGEVSCFANFASVSQVGSAKLYDKFGNTSEHLIGLLNSLRRSLGNCPQVRHVVLVGFSRGGIVLNQLVTELAHYENDQLWSCIDEVRWLDSGNSPDVGAFPLDEQAMQAFGRMVKSRVIKVLICGTPFQWNDPFRRHVVAERRLFTRILHEHAQTPQFCVRYYFVDEMPNIGNHFEVLTSHLDPLSGVDITDDNNT
uniref:Uncharacterized protein n=1 Tax=Spongospora subterranea TaxID=70186 RepID=A0A0H5QGY3_9EUKA|eukprot:CRZ01245.1 hypothetical protein [Spongospora subterranea]